MRRLYVLLLFGMMSMVPGMVRAQEIVVSQEGPVRSLGQAVRQARPGSKILVKAGVYREADILVDRPVHINGEPGAVIQGPGNRQILIVKADGASIRGLTLRGVDPDYLHDNAAIRVDSARGVVIEGNRIENAYFGIYLKRTEGTRIIGNVLASSGEHAMQSGSGIHFWYSRGALVDGNTISGHRDGIYLEFTEETLVVRNRSVGNIRYGLHFMYSDRCTYRGNLFKDNESGVAVMWSRRVVMIGNRFENSWGPSSFGLLLKEITDGRVEGNLFRNNTVGVFAEGASRMQIRRNNFYRNGWAMKVMANSTDSRFSENNFIANSFDVSTNSRENYSTFAGNYWDNYEGYDLDRDGAGDVPFRPVRLFALMVEQNDPVLLLLRSFFVGLMDAAERIIPALTPETLVDQKPAMRPIV